MSSEMQVSSLSQGGKGFPVTLAPSCENGRLGTDIRALAEARTQSRIASMSMTLIYYMESVVGIGTNG